jgi:hypothetical protein
MKKKLLIFIAVLQSITLCYAGKKHPAKEQIDAKVSDSLRIDWNDSLKTLMALAEADLHRNDSASAMKHYETAYMIAVNTDNKADLIAAGMYIGKQYIKTDRNKPAEVVLEQVFNATEPLSRWDIRLEASDLLAQLFSLRAYYVRANFFLKQTFALREKSAALIIQKQRDKLQAEFDAMVKWKEKAWKQKQSEAQEAAASKEQYINYLLIGIGVFFLFIIILFIII